MCDHSIVKCLSCGAEGSPAHFLGQGKKKTMSDAALAARKANAAKPRPSRRKPVPDPPE
jgi:hypothetical protein